MGERRVLLDEKESKKTRKQQGKTDAPKKEKGEKPKKKKKKSCCCSCLITFTVTLAVILIAGAGVGWYFGDKFTKANLNMSLSECFSVVSGLYSPNEKKIVTNGYTENDLDAFYSDLKKAVFLNENADISVDTIYELINSETAPASSKVLREGEQPPEGEEGGETQEQQNDALMKYIAALFTKENVDLTALKDYDETRHDQYLLNIKDKGLAAFVDAFLRKMLSDNDDISSALGEYGIDDISPYVSLKQIIFGKRLADATVTEENGDIGKEMKEVSTLSFTVKVSLADAVKPVLKKYGAGAAHFLVKLLIPNDLYLTLETGLDADIGTNIRINRIDSEEKADKAFALADGIMNLTGEAGEGLKAKLDALVAEKVRPFVDRYIGYADLDAMGDGVLKVDPFETIASIALPPEEGQQPLTGSEILGTLSGMLTTDYKNAIDSNSTHNDQYKAEAGEDGYNAEYKTVYAPARLDKDNLVDYKQEFLNELSEKYLIDLDGEDGISGTDDDILFSDFMALFGIGTSDKKVELMQLIDGERMKDLLGKDAADIVVNVNDRMMGAIISETLPNVLGDFDIADGLEVQQIIMREKDGRQFIELGVSASVSAFMSSLEGNPLGSVVNAFVPETVMLSVNVDVTRGSLENEYVKTQIRYNDSTAEKTEQMLGVIGRFADSLDVEALAANIAAPLREMLGKMYDMLGGLRLTQSKMILPDVFEIMSDLLFTTEGGEKVVTGGEIKSMLSSLTTSDEQGYLQNTLGIDEAANGYDAFMGEIKDKYYIVANSQISTFDDIFKIVDFENFDSANFDLQRLKSDDREASELRPKITDAELAHVFAEKMSGASLASSAGIKGIKIGSDGDGYFIKLAIELKLADALGADMASVIPVQKVYVVATCRLDSPLTDTDGTKYFAATVTVNQMSGAQLETLNKMIAHLGGGSLDMAAMEKELGKIIYDSFETMKSSLGEGGFEFTDGGILITDFYSFLAKATQLDTKNTEYGATEEQVIANVKAAVQGLYKGDGANNFSESDIVSNAAVPVDLSTADGIEESFENYSYGAQGFEGQMADNRFAGYLYERFAEKDAALKELTIVNSGNAEASSYYEELAAMGVTANGAHDYIRLVVSVDFSRLTSGGESNLLGAFMPTEMYVTVYIDMNDKTSAMRINNLSAAAQKVLFAMTKLDAASLSSVLNDALDVLDDYAGATFVDSPTQGAVGSIKTKFDLTA